MGLKLGPGGSQGAGGGGAHFLCRFMRVFNLEQLRYYGCGVTPQSGSWEPSHKAGSQRRITLLLLPSTLSFCSGVRREPATPFANADDQPRQPVNEAVAR